VTWDISREDIDIAAIGIKDSNGYALILGEDISKK
jgi:hypothetical protein